MVAFWEPQMFWAAHVYNPLSLELRCSIVKFWPVPLKVMLPFMWNQVKVVRGEAVKLVQDRVRDFPTTIRSELATVTDVFTGGSGRKKQAKQTPNLEPLGGILY